jgi:hypothetical protein
MGAIRVWTRTDPHAPFLFGVQQASGRRVLVAMLARPRKPYLNLHDGRLLSAWNEDRGLSMPAHVDVSYDPARVRDEGALVGSVPNSIRDAAGRSPLLVDQEDPPPSPIFSVAFFLSSSWLEKRVVVPSGETNNFLTTSQP